MRITWKTFRNESPEEYRERFMAAVLEAWRPLKLEIL